MVLRSDSRTGSSAPGEGQAAQLDRQLAELSAAADRFDAPEIKRTLRVIVPEYTPQDNASVL
jgi:hypothetical protein